MDIWVVCWPGLLWIKILWTFVYISLCSHMWFLWPCSWTAQVSFQGSLLQGAQLTVSGGHIFGSAEMAVPSVSCLPQAVSSQWLNPDLSHFYPVQDSSNRPYFLAVSHQSGRESQNCSVRWFLFNPSFILCFHSGQACNMLWRLYHKTPPLIFACVPKNEFLVHVIVLPQWLSR